MTTETAAAPASPTAPAAAGAGTTPAPAGAPTPATAPAAATPAPTAPATTPAATPSGTVLGGKPQGEQGQPAGKDKTTPAPGAELVVNIPEGFTPDPKFLGSFKSALNDDLVTKAGLKPEVASEFGTKLAALYAQQQKDQQTAQLESYQKQSLDWENALKADKDFGGANLKASVDNIDRVRSTIPGAREALKALDACGLGNHPEVCKFISEIGKALREDTSSAPKAKGQGAPQPMTLMERMARVLETPDK